MNPDESVAAVQKDPIDVLDLGPIKAASSVVVHWYRLQASGVESDYLLAFADGSLLFWGYPHEFARSADALVVEIGSISQARLAELKTQWRGRR